MGFVGRGDDDEVDGRVGEEGFEGAEDGGFGVGLGGFVSLALEDGAKLEAGHGGDHGGVKGAGGVAEAEEGYADGVR